MELQENDRDLAVKQLALVYRRYPFSLVSSVLLSALIVAALWPLAPVHSLLAWMLSLWLVMGVRGFYSQRYIKRLQVSTSQYDKWRKGLMIGAAVSGFCWGISIHCFASSPLDPAAVILTFAIAGVTAFACISMAAVPGAAQSFIAAALLPLAMWQLLLGERLHLFMGVITLGYLALMWVFARQMHAMLRDSLANSRHNEVLKTRVEQDASRMKWFFESAPGFFHIERMDMEGKLSMPFASTGIQTIFDLTPEQVASSTAPLFALVSKEDIEPLRAAREASLAALSPLHVEFRIKRGEQGERWIEMNSLPQRDPDGATSWYGFMQDITGRKQTDLALRLSEEQAQSRSNLLNAIVDSSPDVIVFALDTHYRYLSFNQKHKHTMQLIWGKEIAVGMSMLDVIGNRPDRETAKRGFDRALSGECFVEENSYGDESLLREHWQTFWSPIRSGTGQVTGLTCFVLNITERRRMELVLEQNARHLEEQAEELEASQEQLQQAEAWYRGIVQSAPDGMVVVDEDGRISLVNERLEAMFGYTSGELYGQPMEILLPAGIRDSRVGKREGFFASAAAGRPMGNYINDLRACRKDGSEFPVDVSLSRLPDSAGRKVIACAAIRDITEHKRLEDALAVREQQFRTLLENTPDAVVRFDLECRRVYVNAAWERANGLSRDAVLGKTPMELSVRAKPIAAEFETMLRRAMASGRSESTDLVWRNAAGERVCFALSAIPEFDTSGQVISVLTVARDISDRKRMEEALALRERELRTLVENAPDTIARYDRDCRRVYANPALIATVEGGASALLGTTPTECPGGKDAADYEARLAEVLASGEGGDFELSWSDKTGGELCAHVRLTPERNEQGEVVSVLAVGRDITELSAHRRKIYQMAFYDSLTSLPNRALFNDRLRQMLADASWHDQLAGVMMLDLDRFKVVNDTLGHTAGDELLREAAARLLSCVRSYDTVARLGGDEFAILLPDVRFGSDLGGIATKILRAFSAPFVLDGKEVFIGTSIGIALFPDDGIDADDLLKYADSAMYFSKRSGRNTFRFYSKELTASANDRLMLEADLHNSLERGELELHFQPKVHLADGKVAGSEALLRWRHPQRGMIAPDRFIPIAEDNGLIVPIGEWVLRAACRSACEWNAPDSPPHKVAINLSARQFQSGELTKVVAGVLDETGCRPEWIELEITESLLLDEDGSVLDMLNDLRAMGITIAIDDFGTGYSALSYLARYPIDTLKIDRSFTRRLCEHGHHAELVKAIITMAICLKQQVVAEGVETPEQALLLQSYGCEMGQGYFYGRPVPAEEFAIRGLTETNSWSD